LQLVAAHPRTHRPDALSLGLDIELVTECGAAQIRSASQSVIQPVVSTRNNKEYMRKSFSVERNGLREFHQARSMSEHDSQQWGEGGRYIACVIPCSPGPGDPFAYATPLADCDLASALAQRARPLNTALVVAGLLEAVQACHRMGIYHGDLKPANVLMYGDNPRLTDFGLAGSLASFSARLSGSKGYRYFWNAEYSKGLAEAADLWSLGVLIREVMSRQRLFSTSEVTQLADEHTTAYDLFCFLRRKGATDLVAIVTRDLTPSAIPAMLGALQTLVASVSPPAKQEENPKPTNKRALDSTTATFTHCDEPAAAKRSKCMRKHVRRKAAKHRLVRDQIHHLS
jgi:hypothetical protein